jgi:hypothetical protein
MNQLTRRLSLTAAAGLLAATATAVGAAPALAATDLGGINVQAYCSTNYPGSSAQLVAPYDASSWRCFVPSPNGIWVAVNMNLACIQQYGSGAYAAAGSGNPYSWRCWR